MSRAAQQRIPADHLAAAHDMAAEARRQLEMAYRLLKPHNTMAIQCEVAGKAARNLKLAIEARQKGVAP